MAGAVKFTGWVPPGEVGALLQTAFAVVIPSRWREPFGLVALQAAEASRPVVASRVGGLPEIVQHGVTGILVPPDDADALGRGLKGLFANPAQAARMGVAARRHKRAVFHYEDFVASYERLYRALAGRELPRGMRA